MAFMFCMGTCCICNGAMSFNPELVPAFKIDGRNQPVCLPCLQESNRLRIAAGLDPFPDPLPGAYDAEEVP